MTITFDLDFDGVPWPGPLAGRDAAAGEAWVGPMGFLSILESMLGLSGRMVPESVRAFSLIPALRSAEGFWSKSAEADPIGTARTLLRWRDGLRMAGWRGEAEADGGARLRQLASVTSGVRPGIPDRLAAVASRAACRRTDVRAVRLFAPEEDLPPLWKGVLEALRAGGAAVENGGVRAAPTDPHCDLAGARAGRFTPRGDGSLMLLRAQGPLAAAEETAAWLSATDWRDALLIGADAVLESALRRHGLPAVGAASRLAANALLEALPLSLAMGWAPPDPARALELLTLGDGPIPRSIAGGLADALNGWPAVDSDGWRKALEDGLAALPEGDRRTSVRRRLETLFAPSARGGRYPTAAAMGRADALSAWAHGRLEHGRDDPARVATAPFLAGVIAQCSAFRALIEASGLRDFTAPQMRRLVEQATSDAPAVVERPAEAGLHSVSVPGAAAGPARLIVWWGFTRTAAPTPGFLPWTAAEREELAAAGVLLPDPGRQAEEMAARWRRPLSCAGESLLLSCPLFAEGGEEQAPHPLWDEIASRASGAGERMAVGRPVFRAKPPLRNNGTVPLPRPVTEWRLPAGVVVSRRERESPSGAASLIGCPFQWVLRYAVGLREGRGAELPGGNRLAGSMAHGILARVLGERPREPAEAEREAGRLFDEEGPRMAAALFAPGSQSARMRVRAATLRAARTLVADLRSAGLSVVAVEEEREMEALGGILQGRPDLVAGPPPVIVDLKWHDGPYRGESLGGGAAWQLSCYAFLHHEGSRFPDVSYFLLDTQRMLTNRKGLFPAASVIEGATPRETWDGFEAAYGERRSQLDAGRVLATGERDRAGGREPASDSLEDGVLRLAPPCRFCAYGLLCGHGGEG